MVQVGEDANNILTRWKCLPLKLAVSLLMQILQYICLLSTVEWTLSYHHLLWRLPMFSGSCSLLPLELCPPASCVGVERVECHQCHQDTQHHHPNHQETGVIPSHSRLNETRDNSTGAELDSKIKTVSPLQSPLLPAINSNWTMMPQFKSVH